MSTAVSTLCQAAAVTGSAAGSFVAAGSKDLIVVRANVLCLYTWDTDAAVLRAVAEKVLPTRVTTIVTVPCAMLSGPEVAGRDAVLLMTSETAVSIVHWDDDEASFVTLSLLVLDTHAAVVTPNTSMRTRGLEPLVRVDRAHGCIGVLTHRRFLHLLWSATTGSAAAASGANAGAGTTAAAAADGGWADDSDDDEKDAATAAKDTAATAGSAPEAAAAPVSFTHSMRVVDLAHGLPTTLLHVRDYSFMTGTTECTIAVLRDVDPTWAGRVKLLAASGARVKGLSCSVTTVALPKAGQPLIVTDTAGIPHDALRLHPIEDAAGLGGAIVVCANAILHISMKGQSRGAWLNRHGEDVATSERTPIVWETAAWEPQAPATARCLSESADVINVTATKDTVRVLLFAHDNGTVYKLTLGHDQRSVHRIALASIGQLTQWATVSIVDRRTDGITAFAGSHLADSVLFDANGLDAPRLRAILMLPAVGPVTSFALIDGQQRDEELENARGAKDLDEAPDPFGQLDTDAALPPVPPPSQGPALRDSLEAMDVALCGGREAQGRVTVTSKHARVDTVLRTAINCAAAFGISSEADVYRPVNGAETASILKEALEDTAAKRTRSGDADQQAASASTVPKGLRTEYVLLTTGNSSLVIRVGQSLQQLDASESAFASNQRTVDVITRRPEGADSSVAYAFQFTRVANEAGGGAPAAESAAAVGSGGAVLAVDLSDVTKQTAVVELPSAPAAVVAAPHRRDSVIVALASGNLLQLTVTNGGTVTVESLDSALPDGARCTTLTALPSLPSGEGGSVLAFLESGDAVVLNSGSGSTWSAGGTFAGLADCPQVLRNDGKRAESRVAVRKPGKAAVSKERVVDAVAARLTAQGGIVDANATLALARGSGELCVYRLSQNDGGKLKLVKVLVDTHDVPAPESATMSIAERKLRERVLDEASDPNAKAVSARVFTSMRRLRGSSSVLDGVLVKGAVPKVIVSDRGLPRLHPMRVAGDLVARSFTALDCAQCPSGFVMCTPGQLVFGRLSAERLDVDLRAPWPRRRVPSHGTPRAIAFNSTRGVAFVAASRLKPFRPTRAPFDTELEVKPDERTATVLAQVQQKPVGADEGIPIPENPAFAVHMFDSTNAWQQLDTLELLENEAVLCMSILPLFKTPPPSLMTTGARGPNHYHHHAAAAASAAAAGPTASGIADGGALAQVLVIGTGFPLGEDHPCRGRLLTVGVSVNGRGDGASRKMVVLASENTKGPVTAVTSVEGVLVAAVGATIKVMLGNWTQRKLVTRAFAHAPTYVTSLSSIKNYIVIGDLQRSVCFARYMPQHQQIEAIAHDPSTKDTLTTGTLIGDGKELRIVTFDSRDNLQSFKVQSRVGASGVDLVRCPLIADAQAKISGTVRCCIPLRQPAASRLSLKDTTAQLFATAEGEIGIVAPVSEKDARRCRWLSARLAQEVAHVAGLHPVASRQGSVSAAVGLHGQSMNDVDLVRAFLHLSADDRKTLATRAGITADAARAVVVTVTQECDWF